MAPNENPSRKTNIIDNPVALAQSLNQNRKGKGKGQANGRATGGSSVPAAKSTGVSKPKASRQARPAPAPGQQFYEGHGLKVPFNEKGQPRAHARASTTFRNRNTEAILDIVEAYAGSGKRHEFRNADKSKVFLGNWIEIAETLAFGANPATKLTRADWAASGFTHPDQRSTTSSNSGKRSKNAPRETEEDLEKVMYDLFDSQENKRKHLLDKASDQYGHVKKQKREQAANSQNDGIHITKDARTAKSEIGKRISDNARIQTDPQATNDAAQQDAQRKRAAEQEAREKQNLASYTITDSQDRKRPGGGTRHMFSTPSAMVASNPIPSEANLQASEAIFHEQAPAVAVFSGPMPTVGGDKNVRAPAAEQARLKDFMHDTGLDSRDSARTSAVVLGPMRRVLTVTESARDQVVLHSTVLTKFNYDAPRASKPTTKPYLKKGTHGPGGVFDNDPDRATGLGHDYELEDARNFATFMELKSKAAQRQLDGKPVFPQALQDFKTLQPWYTEYVRQYPGKRLNQWPCGCSKVVEGDGNESEEE